LGATVRDEHRGVSMNLFDGDRERHVPGRTPKIVVGRKPAAGIMRASPGFRLRVTQSVRNGNYAKMGLRKLFGDSK